LDALSADARDFCGTLFAFDSVSDQYLFHPEVLGKWPPIASMRWAVSPNIAQQRRRGVELRSVRSRQSFRRPFARGFLGPDLEMLDDQARQMPTAIPATDELLVILAYFLARLR
jgi:hypothetical protein